MHAKWAAVLSGAGLLLGAASVSAQAPLTLSPLQLDGVVPAYQYEPSRYPLRVIVEALTVADPDRVRDLLTMEDPETSVAAQQMALEEPEVRCTPARRALLASAGNSEAAAPQVIAQGGLAPGGSGSLTAQAASPAAAWRGQRLAAASPAAAIGDAASPAMTNVGSSARQIAIDSSQRATLDSSQRATVDSSQRATVAHLEPNQRRGVSDSRPRPPAAVSAGPTGRRAPAAAVASRPEAVAVPNPVVRSDNPSGSAGASALRLVSGPTASDIMARARARVDRAMSGVGGGAVGMRR